MSGRGRGSWLGRVFSTDHKVVGLQYGFTASAFLLLGFVLMLVMRRQLAYPGEALPWIASLLGEARAPGGVMAPEFYNQLGAMHGTIMVFLAIVPLVAGAFGNYLVPLQIGAADMAFPRLNMLSYWIYLAGGVLMVSSFFAPGGAAAAGWTSYPPLASVATVGQTLWLLAMLALIASSLLGSINILVTILQLRAPGLDLLRLPFFCWAQLVTALLLLLAFPALQAAAVLQLMDRLVGTSFFLPSGLVVNGEALAVSGGGSPLLWQHLFWFLAHPEVYVLILPAFGIVAEVLCCHARRPLWGYRWMVGSTLAVGALSFVVWAHHMFLTGMGTVVSSFFQATTMIISIPSVIILTCLLLTLWGGRIRFTVPMLFALAFLPMFGLGGLTGLPLGLAAADIQLHDTYYVVGHFHYIVAPGTLFAIFAGIYHWFPKVTGRNMSSWLGHLHFWPSLVCMNGIFLPMFAVGLAGVSRRLYDGGETYEFAQGVLHLNRTMSQFAWALAAVQVVFLINLFGSLLWGRKVDENPWRATTVEWSAPSPPLPHANFAAPIEVIGGPYGYGDPAPAGPSGSSEGAASSSHAPFELQARPRV
ncbi:MAG: cytochrome C oxidase subunit I [Acidobacteria bacterium]|nr:MAG: cytochrome C oxidase subunit I [Acidobacteriota bacterium]REK05625.1 MAG: cytochrome C oxidase subunit I [Acidobacteriota bacterium]